MKKNLIIISLVSGLLVGVAVFSIGIGDAWTPEFGKKTDRDITITSTSNAKKKIDIKEIQDQSVFTIKDMAGYWVLFMHLPNETQTVDLSIDNKGRIINSSDKKMLDNVFSIDKNGKISMHISANMRFTGSMQPDRQYLNGMVSIKGKRRPIPFSACKISDKKP
ncbi:MAG: hypothetical protein J7L53_04270 [Deltaproteobacteria bacterium]|nr:hypothetical protein [Deltaproteobacteria bacterium]